MPITSENYKKFEDYLSRAKNDPNADQSKIGRIETELRSYYEGESSGVLPSSGQSDRRPGIAGYYYEPSLDEFHSAIKNPEVYKQIGSPDINLTQQGDKSSGAAYIESKVPELAALNKTDTEHLGEESPEYKAYSDYAYNQEKTKNPDLKRYNDLEITQNPFKKSLGAAIKYGAPAALGAEKSIGLGLPRRAAATIAGNTPDSAADISYDPMGAPQGPYNPNKEEAVMKGARQLESLSPTANFIGNAAGYAAPIAPANLAARGMMAGLGYETAGALTKAAISGLVGSTVASGEGAAQDVIENPGISGQQLLDNTKGRAFWGAVGGAGGDFLAQGAGRTQKAFEESPRWNSIKNQKDIGGDTNLITGIETTPSVRENVRQGALGRQNKTPQDIAAMKVAPKIRDSVDNQLTSEASKINKQIEDYTKSPEGLGQHSADPAVDRLLAMAEKGTVSMPVSGRVVSANRPAAETIRKNLQEFADFAHVSPEEAKSITEQHGGRVLSNNQANILGLPQENGKVHVVVPGKFNAEALLKKEDQIARNLKYDTKEGGVDNPVLQEMNQAFKEIRDKFKYGGETQSSKPTPQSAPVPISETYNVKDSDIAPSSVGTEKTEVTQDSVPPRDLAFQKDPNTGTRRELSPSEYAAGVDVDGPNVGNNWNDTVPEAERYAKELNYKENIEAQKSSNNKTSQLLNGEFAAYDTPAIIDKQNPFDKNELNEINKIRYEQKFAGDLDPETIAAKERVKANRTKAIQGRDDNGVKRLDSPEANSPTTPAFPAKQSSSSIDKKLDDVINKLTGKESVPTYEQRKIDLENYLKTHEGHITKQMAGQKMGWDQKPEWQVDQLVKEGKLEQVPPGEKQFGQIDIEYRVPKTKKQISSVVEDLPESQYQEDIKSQQSPKIKSTMGLESQLDAQLLKRDISDQAKLDGVENPLRDHSEKATNPTQLTATLDDGTVVYGFSALRRKQHEALKALEEAKKGTGAATKEGAHSRALAFKSGEGHPYQDEQLAQEADRLGLRQQLEEIPATREYPGLRARSFGGGGEGVMNTIKDAVGFRLDPVLGAIAGEPRNPYTPLPNTPAGRIQQYLFRQGVPMYPLLEQRGGIGAARFADDYADSHKKKE